MAMPKKNLFIIGLTAVMSWCFCALAQTEAQNQSGSNVRIVKSETGWVLLRNGEPFYVKGAVAGRSFDLLNSCGANSIRTSAHRGSLDNALKYGFSATANLPVIGERNGIDWDNADQVAKQKKRVLEIVQSLKDHPAVLFWTVGNELEWIPPGIPHHPEMWSRLNDLAIAIHEIDPNHPVMTVIGTGRDYEDKIQAIAKHCTDMDLLGVNSYGDIAKLTELTRCHWPKPYVMTEWGPTGHWQRPKTAWGAPLEQTGTEKANCYYQRYRQVIAADKANCLGSYAFLWSEHKEATHTWYGLFQGQLQTEGIGALQYCWSGTWPQNRAPAILDLSITGFNDKTSITLKPRSTHRASGSCYDPDHDALTFRWEIRPEVVTPPDSYAGGGEIHSQPIAGLIQEPQNAASIAFTAPKAPGPYRLFVQVLDGNEHVGYANIPFQVTD